MLSRVSGKTIEADEVPQEDGHSLAVPGQRRARSERGVMGTADAKVTKATQMVASTVCKENIMIATGSVVD